MRAKDNPFKVSSLEKIEFVFNNTDWPELLERLKVMNYRGALVGHHGSGKSKLLNEFEQKLIDKDFRIRKLFLNMDTRKFPPGFLPTFYSKLTANDIIMFDGAEQLSKMAWNRFEKKSSAAGGLVITCHEPGMLPTLIETESSVELFKRILAGIAPEEVDSLGNELEPLLKKHSGNLRDAFRELYDTYSEK
jgi:hypothetical protein